MSTFCCLRPNAATDGMDPAKPANRRGISKTGDQLLAGQQNGMGNEFGGFGMGLDEPYYCKYTFPNTQTTTFKLPFLD
jgi:hypothetical protein